MYANLWTRSSSRDIRLQFVPYGNELEAHAHDEHINPNGRRMIGEDSQIPRNLCYDTLPEDAARRRGHVRWKGERSA
jgi:hypothetical protein